MIWGQQELKNDSEFSDEGKHLVRLRYMLGAGIFNCHV